MGIFYTLNESGQLESSTEAKTDFQDFSAKIVHHVIEQVNDNLQVMPECFGEFIVPFVGNIAFNLLAHFVPCFIKDPDERVKYSHEMAYLIAKQIVFSCTLDDFRICDAHNV